MLSRLRRIVCLFTVLLALSGCAAPGKRLEPPRISLVHIAVQESSVFETILNVELRVFNTNETALEMKGLDCKLELNGKDFAQGVAAQQTTIPAYGTAKVPLTLYSSLIDMVRGVLEMGRQEKLKYKISGKLRVEGGFMLPSAIPFSSKGEIALDQLDRM
ncbi:water stress/hypersensitive response domain-cont aining protein [Desulfonema ishimotonii]|uniref:Water stress/hypersensitive response domain-cont aining protein n=1 Tax=Desulfonema ishimotonii TaxID=45657 RepID=A0A401G2V5_9BACT|nr:LEA type 2 family protein [Desulfonema ishimotonii]GBC63582.1 water stress/hypersensitive response domain-cont aining protein [Desulfonema ishimotonii]